jgi:hypothetical protein
MKRRKEPKPIVYQTPIALPEASAGDFRIAHEYLKPENGVVALVSGRESFLTGRRAVGLKLTEPLKIHTLIQRDPGKKMDRVWMSDEPQELRQMAEWIRDTKPAGHVLVGGLGLGVVATWLAQSDMVDQITVVEKSPEVIELVRPHQMGYDVVCADIAEYLRTIEEWPFDFAILDTWQGTSEATWWEEVMPLRRIIANSFGRQDVHCWAEDMMAGQIARSLLNGNRSRQEEDARRFPGMQPHGRGWHYENFPEEMSEDDIRHFIRDVGLPEWEEKWGGCLLKTEAA